MPDGPKLGRFAAANRKRVEAAKLRQVRSLELRLQGHSIRQIAEQIGVDQSTIFRDVQSQLRLLVQEGTERLEELRALELARLDAVISAHWSRAVGEDDEEPDVRSAMVVLRALADRAKLLGLYIQEAESPRPLIQVDELRQMHAARQRSAIERVRAVGIEITLPLPLRGPPATAASSDRDRM